jgi:hypothetical protein
MGCANAYDWVTQSEKHRAYARSRLPFISQLAEASTTYGAFISQVNELDALGRTRYNNEFQRWWRSYGHTWDRIGCVNELEVGEHTQKFAFKKDVPNRRAHAGAPFAGMIGAELDVDKPALEPGYVWCSGPPTGALPISEERTVTDKFGWTYVVHASTDGDTLFYLYHDTMTNSDFWACPWRGSIIPSNRAEVKTIQRALSKKGYNPGTIDGIWGPKTCQAAYAYKRTVLKDSNITLGANFWSSLSLPAAYLKKYARSCDKWYTGDLGPVQPPGPVEPAKPTGVKPPVAKPPTPAEVTPEPAKAGFSVWMGLILAGGMLAAAFVAPVKRKKRRKKR